ncbi:MAG: HNH endonuclease [Phycisphaerales bacterium]
MASALSHDVLVLNRNWAALRVITAAEALADLFVGRVEAVDENYRAYNFASWHELSEYAHEFEPEGRNFVKTVTSAVLVPSVVRLLRFDRIRRRSVRLSRKNVYLRDNYTCQYTGRKLPASRLNLDHVIPTSRGGKTTWENLVCCCVEVNMIKGNKTPRGRAEADLSAEASGPDRAFVPVASVPPRYVEAFCGHRVLEHGTARLTPPPVL